MRAASKTGFRVVMITTCDPSTRKIEGRITQDKTIVPITIVTIPSAFRWPQIGELWRIQGMGNDWALAGRYEGSLEKAPVETLHSGDVKLDGDRAVLNNGEYVLSGPVNADFPFEVTGSKSSGAALQSLLTKLVAAGLIIDHTTA